VGQYSFSLATGSNTKPLYNCNDVTFDYSNTSGQTVRLYIFYKLNSSDAYTQIPGYFNVSNGASSNYGNSSSGFYKAEFKNATGTSTLYASSEYEVEIRPTPSSPVITSNTPICEGATLTFNTTAVSGGTFSWTGVNGFLGTGIAPSITNATAASTGNYSATVTVDGCTSAPSNTLSTTVNTRPTVNITSPNTTICYNDLVSVNMNVTAFGTCTVTLNDGGIVTGLVSGVNPFVKRPTVTTEYHIISAVDQNCPSAASDLTGSITVSVDALSAGGTIAGSTTVCTGTNSATLTLSGNTGSITKWQSSTDALFTTPSDILTTTSSYSVSNLTSKLFYRTVVKNGVCAAANSSNADVSINPLPAKPTLTSSTICEGQTTNVSMSLPAGTYTYTWIVPTGVATSTTKTISTSKAGTYSLTITDANSCTSDIGTGTVTVNPLPAKPTLTSATICDGETATVTMLTPTGTNTYTYTWTVPTGVATSTTKTVSTNKAGTYSLTITDVNSCTSEVGTGTVTVNPLPTLTITNPAAVCAPGTIDLTATTITAGSTASLTYSYFTNATATNTLTNTSLIGASGTYYIKGTSTLNCSAIQPVNTIINPIPSFNILSPSVCVGSVFTINVNPISGTSSDFNYTWVVPTGVANPGNVSNFTTTIPGVYTATIKNKSTNCESAALNNTVTFYPLPTAAAIVASDNKVMEGTTLNLTAAASGGTGAYLYTWVPNSTTNYTISGGSNALFNALREGTVNIKYQVKDANNCSTQSADFVITITPATIIFEIPNAFTPNGDGMNDELKIISNAGVRSLTSFKIFSRSGNLVFESRDLSRGWDGRYNGNLLPADIYYWTAVYVDRNNVTNPKNGTVLLLK
jgi:gliding motility-associated-like protein